MVDSKKFEDWVRKAEQDLRGAQTLLKHGDANELVAFHSQQAVEKILKAYLLHKAEKLAEGHSLVYLNRECQRLDKDFSQTMADARELNNYYIETRYPADEGTEVTNNDAKEGLAAAVRVVEFTKKKMGL
ncbi:HEPN domain-containing protein [Geosporobacter ferrireducens]|uniref:HEPN domain-containing protein n=1 Tax=Geosporobacter ferrireducens TaxID=1424294 RepID=UPI00139C3597|nr:HEPN domain-containing protein [Geosporobacter ferrireducens]MTI53777.1 HEPN domain-containing protein [Geosporobacter ferrireducens]